MLGATVYTFSIILAMFLVGLGIGSSAGAFLARTVRSARVALGVCQILIAGAAAWGAFMITRSIPYWPINLYEITKEWGPWYIFLLDLFRAGCAVLPAAVLWGASFPLALAAVAARDQDSGRMVGSVYAANTVGAIVGFAGLQHARYSPDRHSMGAAVYNHSRRNISAGGLWPFFVTRQKTKKKGAKGARTLPLSGGKLAWALLSLAAVILLVILVSPVPWIAVAFGRHAFAYMPLCIPGIVQEQDVPYDPEDADNSYCIMWVKG